MEHRRATPPRHSERGFTLIELLVVITLIAILGAVVAVGVNGFITTANQRARGAQFEAVQKAIKTFVNASVGASGTIEQAKYPLKVDGSTPAKCDSVKMAAAAAASNKFNESTNTGWYGADGTDLTTQPAATKVFCYVDLYSGASTDLVFSGYMDKGSIKATAAPSVTTGATAASDAATGAFFRCIFNSEAADSAAAASLVRTNKGALLACRDSDPFTP